MTDKRLFSIGWNWRAVRNVTQPALFRVLWATGSGGCVECLCAIHQPLPTISTNDALDGTSHESVTAIASNLDIKLLLTQYIPSSVVLHERDFNLQLSLSIRIDPRNRKDILLQVTD